MKVRLLFNFGSFTELGSAKFVVSSLGQKSIRKRSHPALAEGCCGCFRVHRDVYVGREDSVKWNSDKKGRKMAPR